MASREARLAHDVKNLAHGGKSLAREEIDEDEMLLIRSSNTKLSMSYRTNAKFGLS